jgi:hypothetical protein
MIGVIIIRTALIRMMQIRIAPIRMKAAAEAMTVTMTDDDRNNYHQKFRTAPIRMIQIRIAPISTMILRRRRCWQGAGRRAYSCADDGMMEDPAIIPL